MEGARPSACGGGSRCVRTLRGRWREAATAVLVGNDLKIQGHA